MANPVLTSDLFKDDGAIQDGIKQLKSLSTEYESFIDKVKAQSVQLESSVKDSNISTVSQREEFKKTSKQVDELEKQYSKYVDLLDENAVKIAALKTAQQKLNKVNKLEAQIATARNGSVEQLNAQLKLNKVRLEQLTKAGKANTKEGFKLNNQTERLTLQIKEQKDEQTKAIKVRQLERKAVDSQAGSYDQLSAQYSLLKIKLNALSSEQRENTAEGQKMEKQSAAIFSEMKRLQEVTGKHVLNVGNYTNSIVSAFKRQKQLNQELKKSRKEFKELPKSVQESDEAQKEHRETTNELAKELETLGAITGKTSKDFDEMEESNESLLDSVSELPGALGDAGSGIKGLGTKFKALLANPVVLVIGLIVAGLFALFNAFKQSEKGVQFMTKATGVINAIWSQTIGIVDSLVEAVTFLFENPQQAIKDFGQLILDNIVNRFAAVVRFAGIVGDAIGKLLRRDFEGLKDSAKDAASALVQFATGLDAEQQENFAEKIKETAKQVTNQTNAFIALEVAKRAIATSNREVSKSIERLITQEQLLLSIADDNTKSFKVREDAAEEARKKTEARSKKEIQLAKNNLSLVNRELDLRIANGEAVDGLLDQQLTAYQALAAAEREFTLAVRDNEKTRDELKQDRLERDLDILIDGFDNQKTINEKIIADDNKTFENRKQLLEETVQLSDDSFQKQIETIQQFTGVTLDANALIQESDAIILNQKIRSLGLSEIIEGRLLEIIRDRKSANQDLAESERDLASSGRSDLLARLSLQQGLAEAEFELVRRTEVEKSEFEVELKRQTLERIRQLNEQFEDILPPINTQQLEADIKTLESNIFDIRRESAIVLFEQQQELAQSEFDLTKSTEKEKTDFRLNAERDRLLKILELNEKFGSDLTDLQLEIIKNQVKAIQQELEGVGRGFNIFELFGLNLDDEQQQAISDSFEFAKGQVFDFAATRTKAAEQGVQDSNNTVQAAQNVLQTEIANREAGFASEVETAQRQLDLAKNNQKEALREREKAQKAELALQTIEQSANLITASSKIWATLGFPFAIPAIALMWGSFISAKATAFKLAKSPRAKGGLDIIGGGSHASGNDTPLGYSDSKGAVYAERGEAHLVLRKSRASQYKNVLPALYRSLNNGTFMTEFSNQMSYSNDIPVFNNMDATIVDMSGTEQRLDDLKAQGEEKFFKDSNGRLVRKYKNLTQTYVGQ